MLLSELLQQPCVDDFTVTRVTDDSRHVQQGGVFVCDVRIMPNAPSYCRMALEKGARAVVVNTALEDTLFCADVGSVLARWAVHKFPQQPKILAGVTGTNGKTSVAWFYQQLMQMAGKNAASVGTLGVYCGDELVMDTGYTSPNALKLHEILQDLSHKKVEATALEVSSHALDLGRADGCKFTVAGWTNISQDHLDYHKTMDAYAAAKGRLFSELLPETGTAVVNVADSMAIPVMSIAKEHGIRVLSVGTGNAELVVKVNKAHAQGLDVTVKYENLSQDVTVPVLGAFQAENLAVALGMVVGSGMEITPLLPQLSQLKNVPGRMELIAREHEQQPTVVVDFAHTPDALERALNSARPLTKGELWVVFGCGGDRDNAKRPKMGKICAELADKSIVTDDNPRTEDPAKVRAMILQNTPNEVEITQGREAAIRYAISHAKADDVVLIAGKGHESGQIIGKVSHPFDDRNVAMRILKELAE